MAVTALQIVVPTVGQSSLLEPALKALGAERERVAGGLEVVLVHQGSGPVPSGADRVVHLPKPAGFSAAVNAGLAVCDASWVGTVNDDALVQAGWAAALLAALGADERVAAVQGVNLRPDPPGGADGWGLAWNRWLQAVQIGHGRPGLGAKEAPREVFGVSATAAIYRRSALDVIALPPRFAGGPPQVFDERLGSYYEDVQLAGRLRAAGFSARVAPAARALHLGASTMGARRWRLVYGNRYPVAAQLLGAAFWQHVPRMVWRDVLDFGRLGGGGHWRAAAGVFLGWGRALRMLPRHRRSGPPAVPLSWLGLGLPEVER